VSELSEIIAAVDRVRQAARRVDILEEQLKAAKSQLRGLTHFTLPEMFFAATSDDGTPLNRLSLADGTEIKLARAVTGTLPKEPIPRAAALAHLRELNAGHLIKHTFTLEARNDDAAADVRGRLLSVSLEPREEYGVHPQTLAAFGREAIDNGTPVELSVIGLTSITYAKITERSGDAK